MADIADLLPPWFIFRILRKVLYWPLQIRRRWLPPHVATIEIACSGLASQALYVVNRLRVADEIGNETVDIATLAQLLAANERALYRVMRVLAALNIFDEVSPGRFRNNRQSAVLRMDHPNSLQAAIEILSGPAAWAASGKLLDAVQVQFSDMVPFEMAHQGQTLFEQLRANPERLDEFHTALSSLGRLAASGLVKDFPWNRFQRVVDIGGSYGDLLAGILDQNKHMRGVLFDLPEVISLARDVWHEEARHLCERMQFVSGSFVDDPDSARTGAPKGKPEAVPGGFDGDVYLLRGVLRGYTPKECIKILKGIRAAMSHARCTLAVAEIVLEDEKPNLEAHLMSDLFMLTTFGPSSGDRTHGQWTAILTAAGFRVMKFWPTRSQYHVIEAIPTHR